MDLGIKYCGDASICVQLQLPSLQHVTLSLKNLSLSGVLRMKIKLALDELKIEVNIHSVKRMPWFDTGLTIKAGHSFN